MLRDLFQLFRVKHYIKNLLIFIPLFFSGQLFEAERLVPAMLGFVCFCFLASSVYIFNDYRDREKDRLHPGKKNRPLASGKVSGSTGIILILVNLCFVTVFSFLLAHKGFVFLFSYLVLNILYSIDLKNRPIVDIVILASGYVLRIFYGAAVTGIDISKWLFLVVTVGSLFLGLGKRRNELLLHTDSRDVLNYYTESFLDKNMYVCVTLTNVFYALWTFEMPDRRTSWTIPVIIVILMRYSLDVEKSEEGDPIEVLLKDKVLIALIFAYFAVLVLLLYY